MVSICLEWHKLESNVHIPNLKLFLVTCSSMSPQQFQVTCVVVSFGIVVDFMDALSPAGSTLILLQARMLDRRVLSRATCMSTEGLDVTGYLFAMVLDGICDASLLSTGNGIISVERGWLMRILTVPQSTLSPQRQSQ